MEIDLSTTTDDRDLELSEMLCTWICHALVGSVGAMANGLELLKEDPATHVETMALLDFSAMATARRLKFFRAAFGVDGAKGQDGEAVRGLLSDFLAVSRNAAGAIDVHWPPLPALNRLDPSAFRLILILSLLGMECLPRGGGLDISIAGGLVIAATGRGARLETGVAAALTLTPGAATVRAAPASFVARLARRLGGRVTTESTEGRVVLSVIPQT
ncbi:MAG: hypothetical protein HQL37_10135 [Alphaproteobacteria bacterium]|nr:hypothetical protein [Alphaproteobacteria bacterium]